MSTLKPAELRIIERVMRMGEGYVLDFSNRTFAEFFDAEMGVDIDDQVWLGNGTSKANRLRAYLQIANDSKVAKLLRALEDYRTVASFQSSHPDSELQAKFLSITERLEPVGAVIDTTALENFSKDETLGEVISAIERDIQADKPHAAIDRLHTYCMKKFAHLVRSYQPTEDPMNTLTGRAGQYLNSLKQNSKMSHPLTFEILKHCAFVFDKLNELRNKNSLAHDNDLMKQVEARFVFETVCNVLRFVKATEGQIFERDGTW